MSYFKIKSYAKINLALNVLDKSNSLHKIESLVSFLDLHDEINIRKISTKRHKIKFVGDFSNGIKKNNTISQLLENIDKKNLLKNKYEIIVKKNIPLMSGMGGGSMNVAAIVSFFEKQKILALKKKKILEIIDSIGSDVKLGLYSKNLVLKSNNQIKVLSSKKKFYTLIVKPDFGCSTKKIYSKVNKFSKPKFNKISKNMFRINFLKQMKNDLERIVLKQYPKMRILKSFLDNLSHVKFVRMTGSGSAIIAYFSSVIKCKDAEKKVKKQFRNYWCKTSKTI
tara:strand:- start:7 stop:849 length:843 start_codon:yes stop_codon:yes gene_type:complete